MTDTNYTVINATGIEVNGTIYEVNSNITLDSEAENTKSFIESGCIVAEADPEAGEVQKDETVSETIDEAADDTTADTTVENADDTIANEIANNENVSEEGAANEGTVNS